MMDETAVERHVEKCFTLRVEVRQRDVAGSGRHGRSPLVKEGPHSRFGFNVSFGGRVWYPEIELKGSAAFRPELLRPATDPIRRRQQGPHCAHSARVGNCDRRELGHAPAIGAKQDRKLETVSGAERRGSIN
mgnify:CR=1 FL=1